MYYVVQKDDSVKSSPQEALRDGPFVLARADHEIGIAEELRTRHLPFIIKISPVGLISVPESPESSTAFKHLES